MRSERKDHLNHVPEPNVTRLLFSDTRLAPLWLVMRLYLGYEWLSAGWEKLTNPAGAWVGPKAGVAVSGFLQGALQKSTGDHPDVQSWYAWFVQHVALPHAAAFSYLVTFGELVVGIALVLGLFTGIAAFLGGFLNANYLFAGTVSSNPVLFILAVLIMLAWRTAGYWGFDRWLLPRIGVPGAAGSWFKRPQAEASLGSSR